MLMLIDRRRNIQHFSASTRVIPLKSLVVLFLLLARFFFLYLFSLSFDPFLYSPFLCRFVLKTTIRVNFVSRSSNLNFFSIHFSFRLEKHRLIRFHQKKANRLNRGMIDAVLSGW